MNNMKIERLTKNYETQKLTARQIKNRMEKEEQKEQAERNQKPVKTIDISIEWRKSATWGNCPAAYANVSFQDGTYYRDDTKFYASGCGYDKESTVIAEIFNKYLKYTLWAMENDTEKQKSKPYGINFSFEYHPYFDGGIGTNCYYRISEFIGGKFENISSGRTFDVYRFTMN